MILYHMLRDSALLYPRKTAIIYNEKSISYRDFFESVNKLHQCFTDLDIKKYTKIGLILHNSDMYCITLYALSKNESISCLLNPLWNVDKLERMIRNAGLDAVIVEEYVLKEIKETRPELINEFRFISRGEIEVALKSTTKEIPEDETYDISENDLLKKELIQCSSGTTGLGKMGYRTQKNILCDAKNIIATFNYTNEDIVYCPIAMCHGYGLTMGLIAPVMSGTTIVIERLFRCGYFIKHYGSIKPTIFLGTPDVYGEICSYLDGKLFSFPFRKWFFCSGDPLVKDTGKKFHEITGVWINQVLGMMEVSTICANLNPSEDNYMSVGKPVIELKLDQYRPGYESSVFVKGDTVSTEYIVDNKDVPIQLFDGWFHTKDISTMNEAGEIFIKGRLA